MELPLNSLVASNAKKNYSPQPNKLDGYAHMPNRNVLPYFNNKLQVHQDKSKKTYKKKTMRFFGEASRHMMLEEEYADAVSATHTTPAMPDIKHPRGVRHSQTGQDDEQTT